MAVRLREVGHVQRILRSFFAADGAIPTGLSVGGWPCHPWFLAGRSAASRCDAKAPMAADRRNAVMIVVRVIVMAVECSV